MDFDLENPLIDSNNDLQFDSTNTIPSLFLIESDHMPSQHYLKALRALDLDDDDDVSFRREAISSILQVSSKFDSYLSYLATNYLDRFLSSQGIPQLKKPWMLRLLAVSCVSLAAKMKRTEEFCFTDTQGNGGFVFDKQTIRRMEMLVLGALKWRMRSITPFCFISFFISLFKLEDTPLRQALRDRATEIIFKAQNDIKVLEFKPSIVAASALLSASHELLPLHFSCFRKAISSCPYVNKEDLLQCYNVIQGIAMEKYKSVLDMVSSSDTPVNVLDRHFSSSESDQETDGTIVNNAVSSSSTTTTATATTLARPERDLKRRKISGHCNNQTVQVSHQIQQC